MEEILEMIKAGQRIGYRRETISEALSFMDRYRLNLKGKKSKVVSAVSYRIMGLACGDTHEWKEIFAEIDVYPHYAWEVYRELLDSKSKRLDELGIARKQLDIRVMNCTRRQGNGTSDEERREISEIFRSIFL
jgi:hypothetical protein